MSNLPSVVSGGIALDGWVTNPGYELMPECAIPRTEAPRGRYGRLGSTCASAPNLLAGLHKHVAMTQKDVNHKRSEEKREACAGPRPATRLLMIRRSTMRCPIMLRFIRGMQPRLTAFPCFRCYFFSVTSSCSCPVVSNFSQALESIQTRTSLA